METNSAQYWDRLYEAVPVQQLTWFEPIPIMSLKMIAMLNLAASAPIIDVGGGNGFLARHLLALGYTDITVVDFSERALSEGKTLLGPHADDVKWIHGDVLDLKYEGKYDVWHDRACLHFLTDRQEQSKYADVAAGFVQGGGSMIIGTYSEEGLSQSSGLSVQSYSSSSMRYLFTDQFELHHCIRRTHITPANRLEPYTYFSLTKNIGTRT